MLKFRMGWRICPTCERLFPAGERRCTSPAHRQRTREITADILENMDVATIALTEDERYDMARHAIGADLYGVIEACSRDSNARDAIIDEILARFKGQDELMELGRQEVISEPEVFGLQKAPE